MGRQRRRVLRIPLVRLITVAFVFEGHLGANVGRKKRFDILDQILVPTLLDAISIHSLHSIPSCAQREQQHPNREFYHSPRTELA
jgi:hypothetical protein